MGLGDIKWAGLVGLYLGWVRWEAASTATLVAFAGVALFIVARRVASSNRWGTTRCPSLRSIAGGRLGRDPRHLIAWAKHQCCPEWTVEMVMHFQIGDLSARDVEVVFVKEVVKRETRINGAALPLWLSSSESHWRR